MLFSTTQVCKFTGWSATHLANYEREGVLIPVSRPDTRGRGHAKEYSFLQVLALLVARRITFSIHGCHPTFTRWVIDAITGMQEREMVAGFRLRRTHLQPGIASALVQPWNRRGEEALTDPFDVRAAYETIKAELTEYVVVEV